ncbi:hypothetical protein QFZ20_000132 [Flavobacterium sp. W4I14]|nr:hypothetical protein [Flavobacterium sp. W4I14]
MAKTESNQNEYKMVKMIAYCRTPEEYKIFDYRALRPKYFVEKLEDDGTVDTSGVHFISQELDEIKIKDSNIEYYTPNNVGILLSVTNQSLKRAKDIFEELNLLKKLPEANKKETIQRISIASYNFIESFQTSIVFAYTALEAFANLSIPPDYIYKQKNKAKGTVELFDKEAIERWLSLDLKLGDMLVEIYSTKQLKQHSSWSTFKILEDLRHDIIHQKSISRTEFYKKYFKKDVFKVCQCAEEIIDFFYQQQKDKNFTNPLWPWLINKKNYFPIEKFKQNRFYHNPKNFDPKTLKE